MVNNTLKYKGYTAKVELDGKAGVLHGEVIGTPDVITFQADSVENAIAEFHASVDDYLDFCAERGEAPEKPLSGQFLVRATPELHRRVHVAANASGLSVNAWLTRVLEESAKSVRVESKPPPPGWKEDTLSQFLEDAHHNRFATFANKKDWFKRLSDIDLCFMEITKDWLNPTNLITPLFFFRCHASFRAACGHALSGQVSEVFPQIRTCLEYAAYALHIDMYEGLGEKWLRRHDDEKAKKTVINEFKISNVRKSIELKNKHASKVFEDLYQRSIDFGAHPNERAVTGSLAIDEQPGKKFFLQTYLHGDDLSLIHGLKTTAQTGICALEILKECFKARFEILGVRAELLNLRKGL